MLLDSTDGVRQEVGTEGTMDTRATSSTIRDCEIFAKVWAYLTASIVEPVAFVNKKSSGVSRVVVFTVLGVQGVYDRYNLMFAIQVGRKERQYVLVLQKVPSEGS